MTDNVMQAQPLESAADERDPRWVMTIGGALGLIAAWVLTADKIGLLQAQVDGNDKQLGCDLSAFVSCSGVMTSEQSEAFGFANSIIGVAGFAVVVTLGVLLIGGVRLPSFVWAGLQAGVLFGIGFVTWLQFQSIYRIDRLCPYCMVVWAVMIPLFVAVTARNLRAFAPRSPAAKFVGEWSMLIVLLWYVGVIAAIWFHFGDRLWA